jgi:hypothetical protein
LQLLKVWAAAGVQSSESAAVNAMADCENFILRSVEALAVREDGR